MKYLKDLGMNRGKSGARDLDFSSLLLLLNISKNNGKFEGFEYKKSLLFQFLGPDECKRYGRMARRILEEGRRRFMLENGWKDVKIMEYVREGITGDNFVLIGRR